MNDLLLRALRREAVPRRPLWIMRQAGRFLPEYRELRRRHSFEELAGDAELAAQVTLLPFQRFDLDAAIIFADLMTPAAALGIDVRFDPGPVVAEPLRTPEQIAALPEPDDLDPESIAPEVCGALRIVKEELGGRAAVLGFGGAPLSLAAYLVEGRGSKSAFPTLRALAHAAPEAFDELLGKLARLVARYLVAQHRAGADAVQVFDSWAGLLAPRDWRQKVRPHLESLLVALDEAGVPRILVDEMARLPAEAIAVDWRTDLAGLAARHPQRAVQGNLDPAILLAGPEATRRAAAELLAAVPQRGHIVNLGHGVLPETPLESVEALVETVHAEGV
jgi:uroporphyrinogen decarboxylase